MKLLTVEQMKRVDRLTAEQYGVSGLVLMENAGFQLFRALEQAFGEDLRAQRIGIFCGKGNNGGDGFVLARQLNQHGHSVEVFLLGSREDVSGDAATNLTAFLKSGHRVVELDDESWAETAPGLSRFSVAVDALLGTGLTQPLRGLYARVVEELNQLDLFRLAVDIPTGLDADSMEAPELCFRADLTVTFTAPKIAHVLNPARKQMGAIQVVPIGTPERLLADPDWTLSVIDESRARSGLPTRHDDSHKGDYGHVAVVAGSRDKPGAAGLASWAALQAGSGLVTCFTAASAQPVVSTYHAEVMTAPLDETPEGAIARPPQSSLHSLLEGKSAVAVGPGLGLAPETASLVRDLLAAATVPVVLDADAVNAFSGTPEGLEKRTGQPLVLTPHPGEFSRLSGLSVARLRAERLDVAPRFSRRFDLWLVLKDFRTLVATPGGEVLVCPAGNAGMATAGSGDVLTGLITSLVGAAWAQGRQSPADMTNAVAAAVFLHSRAGDLAAAAHSLASLTAGSILEHLGAAFSEFEEPVR